MLKAKTNTQTKADQLRQQQIKKYILSVSCGWCKKLHYHNRHKWPFKRFRIQSSGWSACLPAGERDGTLSYTNTTETKAKHHYHHQMLKFNAKTHRGYKQTLTGNSSTANILDAKCSRMGCYWMNAALFIVYTKSLNNTTVDTFTKGPCLCWNSHMIPC